MYLNRVDSKPISPCQWRSEREAGRLWPPIPEKSRTVGNGEPIIGCLIHRVTRYSGFRDGCVRFSFPVLPFHKHNCHHSNRFKLGILSAATVCLAAAMQHSVPQRIVTYHNVTERQHKVVHAFCSRSVTFLLRCSHVVLCCTTL